jgi:hypothetical protein
LLRDLEANQTAVHGPRRDSLDRLSFPWSATKRAAAREGRSQNQQNHQRFLNAAPALFARAKLAWFCSALVV